MSAPLLQLQLSFRKPLGAAAAAGHLAGVVWPWHAPIDVLARFCLSCDDLWLPTLLIDNVVNFETSTYYYRYDLDTRMHHCRHGILNSIAPCSQSKGGVLWTVQYTGTFYTTMDFRAFPFDKYELIIR